MGPQSTTTVAQHRRVLRELRSLRRNSGERRVVLEIQFTTGNGGDLQQLEGHARPHVVHGKTRVGWMLRVDDGLFEQSEDVAIDFVTRATAADSIVIIIVTLIIYFIIITIITV